MSSSSEAKPMTHAQKIWNTFPIVDQYQCAENEYRCLEWGLYTYEGTYRCGCVRNDVDWEELEVILDV